MTYMRSQLTGKETQRICSLYIGHRVPHWGPSFYSKQRRNKSCSTQSWILGGINYSLWNSRYTDICLIFDLIIIIISYQSFNISWWMVKFGYFRLVKKKKKKPAPILKHVYIHFKINNSSYLDVVPKIVKNTVFDERQIAKICCSLFCFPKVNPQLQVFLGLFKWGAVSEARGWKASFSLLWVSLAPLCRLYHQYPFFKIENWLFFKFM